MSERGRKREREKGSQHEREARLVRDRMIDRIEETKREIDICRRVR